MLAKFLLLVSLFSYRDNLLENLGKLHVLPKNAKSPPPVNVHHSRTPLRKVWKRILGSRDGVVVRAILLPSAFFTQKCYEVDFICEIGGMFRRLLHNPGEFT